MNLRGLLFTLLFASSFISSAINFSRINVAWQYDVNAELRLSHRVFQENGFTHVFLQVEADSLAKWEYQFLVQEGYESEAEREIEIASVDTLKFDNNLILLKLKLPKIDEDILVVKVFEFVNLVFEN